MYVRYGDLRIALIGGVPRVFHDEDVMPAGMHYLGSECSVCMLYMLVRVDGDIAHFYYGPGASIEDAANAVAQFYGHAKPNRYDWAKANGMWWQWYFAGSPEEYIEVIFVADDPRR